MGSPTPRRLCRHTPESTLQRLFHNVLHLIRRVIGDVFAEGLGTNTCRYKGEEAEQRGNLRTECQCEKQTAICTHLTVQREGFAHAVVADRTPSIRLISRRFGNNVIRSRGKLI